LASYSQPDPFSDGGAESVCGVALTSSDLGVADVGSWISEIAVISFGAIRGAGVAVTRMSVVRQSLHSQAAPLSALKNSIISRWQNGHIGIIPRPRLLPV